MTEQNPEDLIPEVVASALVTGLLMSVDQGIPVQKALRAVAVEYLQEVYGSYVWKELGMNQRTVERWRAEYRAVMNEREIAEEPPAHIQEAFLRLEANKPAKS